MIKVDAGEHMGWKATVKGEVEKLPEVVEVYCVFGRRGVIAKVNAKTWNELTNIAGDRIRAIQGVVMTETLAACEE
jgi:DNA-binding Lrp family transcriptional regulator